MKSKIHLFTLIMFSACAPGAYAQVTAFTYQGWLTANSGAASGIYDMSFSLFNTNSGGAPVGGPLTNTAVLVSNGLFTATLDFGSSAFPGADRWLEIAVRTNGGSGFTTLSPRQHVTPTPYAILAANLADGSVTASKLSPGPGTNGQVLKMSGGVLAWGTDLGSGTVNSVGTGLGLTGGPITTSGTVSIDTTVVPQLGAANTFGNGNTTLGKTVSRATNSQSGNLQEWQNSAGAVVASVNTAGLISGNGAGLTNVLVIASNVTVNLAGDVTGPGLTNTLAKIRGVAVATNAPVASQFLRYNGTNWAPSAVALGTDVSGTLALANGGTAATTAAGARSNLGAAASGANSDITSLGGLTTPLSTAQGGTGGNTPAAARTSLGAAASGTNTDILALGALQSLVIKAANQQTADLQDWQSKQGNVLASVSVAGVFSGNGSGLNNITASNTISFTGPLTGDVTGTQSATTVGRLQGTPMVATAPVASQHLRFDGANWTPSAVALGSDVSGTLGVANGGTAATTAPGARSSLGAAASGANSDITSLAGLQTMVVRATNSQSADLQDWQNSLGVVVASVTPAGVISGNGSALTTLNAGSVSSGTLADSRLSANVALLAGNQNFSGANTFGNGANSFVGTFTGNGAGLTNVAGAGGGALAGDVTGPQTNTSVARIRGVSVVTNAPVANQLLRYNGASWTPGAVALATDVSGSLALANGGTGGTTPAGARANLAAAASGANSDITSLSGLTTALSTAQGGTGSTTPAGARTSLGAAASGANSDITSLSGLTTALSTAQGGTGASTPAGARTSLGAAASGANSDITSLSGLTTALSTAEGGTGATTPAGARSSLSAAASGANSDITSLSGLTTALSTAQGGTGATTPGGARTNLAAAASGANADITSMAALQTMVVRATNSQSADLQDWQNSLGVVVASVTPAGVISGNGSGLTTINAGSVSAGTLADARLSANVPLLAGSQNFSGANTFGNAANSFVGTFTGNGAGLTNLAGGGALAGDVTGPQTNTSVARIRGVSVVTNAPVANQLLRYNGASWTPGAVALGTDVSGTLALVNGGTGGTTPAAARANLVAAASGANSDITSLSGLTTALSTAQGGTGSTTPAGARTSLGAAASGANSDITSLSGLTTALSTGQGGTGSTTPAGARTSLGAAASGANSDITSLSGLTTALSTAQGGTGASTPAGARTSLGAAASGANSDLTSLSALQTMVVKAASGQTADLVDWQNSSGVVVASVSTNGTISGNGGGLTNVTTANFSGALAGDVTGTQGATTVARIRGVNVTATAPVASQHLRYDGANWTPSAVALGSDVSGTLALANGGTGGTTPAAARANLVAAASGANSDITSLSGLTTALSTAQGGTGGTTPAGARTSLGAAASGANSDITSLSGLTTALSTAQGGTGATTPAGARTGLGAAASGANSDIISLSAVQTMVVKAAGGQIADLVDWQNSLGVVVASVSTNGTISGNGSGLTTINAGSVSAGTLADARLSANVPLLAGSQSFSGANTFGNAANNFVGTFTGNGAGLTNIAGGGALAGDVTGPQTNTSVARIRGVSVVTNAPVANQLLRYNGASWAPGAVALGTDVSGTLALASGGTGGTTPAAARANLVAAASGANSDITSLSGLTTALSTGQGGTGSTTPAGARTSLGAAASGANSDITSLSGLTTALSTAQGGTGATTPAGARTSLSAAASGANSDITSLSALQTMVVKAAGGQTTDLVDWQNSLGIVVASVSTNGTITGNGSGLNSLNAGSVSLGTLADARLSANIPLLSGNQTFSGVSSFTNAANNFVGTHTGNGAGLSNVTSANFSGALAGDVTGNQGATTVARIRGVNVSATAPAASQHLRYDGANWTPSAVALGSDVSGTLAVANGGTAASTAAGARTSLGAAASGANSDITSLSALSTALSTAQGGTGATTAPGARTSLGAAASGANSDITSLNAVQTMVVKAASGQTADLVDWQNSGGVVVASVSTNGTISGNNFVGTFTGNGAGLTNLPGGGGGGGTLAGDVTGPQTNNTVARIRGVSVVATAPAANQLLRFNGASWAPGAVALASDVSGTLAVANGGTGGTTPAGARASLGAAASGANSDITSLSGLSTPLSAAQGGSGLSSYAAGDVLYASAANTLARLPVGGSGQTLTVTNNAPSWAPANAHTHYGQSWSGSVPGGNGFYVENDGDAYGTVAITAVSTGATNQDYAIFGQASSTNGIAVQGYNPALTGVPVGVGGEADAPFGAGVYGLATAPSGPPTGVFGEAYSTNGIGVYGLGSASAGVPVGVYGETYAPFGYGLYTPDRLFVGDLTYHEGDVYMISPSRIYADAGSNGAPGITFLQSPYVGLSTPATNVLSLATAGTERMRIDASGRMGLGRTPTVNQLEISGDASKAVAGSWNANSDARIKTEVRSLTNALQTIEHVRPVSFHYTEAYRESHPGIPDKTYYNVIAQEFAKVFPDSVKSSGETLDGQPILQVDTYPATIYSITAIQELHQLLKAKDAELEELKRHEAALEKRLQALEQQASLPTRVKAQATGFSPTVQTSHD